MIVLKRKTSWRKKRRFLNLNLPFPLHPLPRALYLEMKLPQSNKVYFFHTQVLSTLNEMEISPVQGNARHGVGGARDRREEEEGKGLRLLPKLPNKTPDPASCGCPTAHPAWHRQRQDRARRSPPLRGRSKQVAQTGPDRNAALPTWSNFTAQRGLRRAENPPPPPPPCKHPGTEAGLH